MTADLSDSEVDVICAGLTQSAAKVRFLKSLGVRVVRKPNGAPLVNRSHYDQVMNGDKKDQPPTGDGPVWGVH